MKKTRNDLINKAAGLGAVAGMRVTIGPAVASHYLSRNPNKALAKSNLSFIQSPVTAVVSKLLSATEMATDKLPSTPNRITFSQTLPRIVSGALMGAIVFQSKKEDVLEGAIIGGASALAVTWASFLIRRAVTQIPFLNNPIVGAMEDALALRCSTYLIEA